MAEADIQLLVGGSLFGGWVEVGVTLAMDATAGAFTMNVTDRWYGQDKPWDIKPGESCEVRVDGETVLTGYVDMVRPGFSSDGHSIEVQGRDKSSDMIDCSAVHKPDEWRGINVLKLATILGAPFGITARAEVDVGANFPLIKLQHGEAAIEALQRYAKQRKLLVMPDGKGGILLTRAGTRRASVELVQGQNIIDAQGNLDWSERFSKYIVKGQSNFSAWTDGATEAHVEGQATDPDVTRYRPLIVISDSDTSTATATDRATWEANSRIGRSAAASITMQGWREKEGGNLWKPNTLVNVRSPWLSMDGEMLIREVSFEKTSGGTFTRLNVVSPQAYAPGPPKKAKKKGGGNLWGAALGEASHG